jgi:xanthine dehydrogenase molybdopterin-binding subunit B
MVASGLIIYRPPTVPRVQISFLVHACRHAGTVIHVYNDSICHFGPDTVQPIYFEINVSVHIEVEKDCANLASRVGITGLRGTDRPQALRIRNMARDLENGAALRLL